VPKRGGTPSVGRLTRGGPSAAAATATTTTTDALPLACIESGLFSYMIAADTGPLQPTTHTYIGYTVLPRRRVRQHNRELAGGARATGASRYRWRFGVIVGGFSSKSHAMSFEWQWKHVRGVPRTSYRGRADGAASGDRRFRMLKKIVGTAKIVDDQNLWIAVSPAFLADARHHLDALAHRVPIFQLQI
jgi:predicted GIY-YIG superfamily endonuclease